MYWTNPAIHSQIQRDDIKYYFMELTSLILVKVLNNKKQDTNE